MHFLMIRPIGKQKSAPFEQSLLFFYFKLITYVLVIIIVFRLQVLYLGGNQLVEIPAEVGYLSELTNLVLCDNRLQSLPPTLINLRNLRSLSLHNNKLSTLPTEIVALNLVELSLRNNPLVNKFVEVSLAF